MAKAILHLSLHNPDEAVQFYLKAFDAKITRMVRNPEDNSFIHAEIDALGQTIAFMGRDSETIAGNTMFMFFRFDKGEEAIIEKAYEVLKDGAQPHEPIEPCFWSYCAVSLIDKYGVHWCLGVGAKTP